MYNTERGSAKLPLFVVNKTNYSTTKEELSAQCFALVDVIASFEYSIQDFTSLVNW
jgi:hypothetical protein